MKERNINMKLGNMSPKEVALEIDSLIPILDMPSELKDNGYGINIDWDPANNWAQLGWLIEYVESKTDKRFLMESSLGRIHDCKKEKCVNRPHRAMDFAVLPELTPTGALGRLQIARLVLGHLRKQKNED